MPRSARRPAAALPLGALAGALLLAVATSAAAQNTTCSPTATSILMDYGATTMLALFNASMTLSPEFREAVRCAVPAKPGESSLRTVPVAARTLTGATD